MTTVEEAGGESGKETGEQAGVDYWLWGQCPMETPEVYSFLWLPQADGAAGAYPWFGWEGVKIERTRKN